MATKHQRLTHESESEPEPEPEPDTPTQTQKQCTFRSNVIGMLGLLSKLNLNNAHLELLKQTPFWMLIDAVRKGKLAEKACMKHDKPILSIIENYDTNDSKFLIGGKKVAIIRNDIKLIFGIGCGNKPIADLNKKKSDVAFATRGGIHDARIGSKKKKDMINEIPQKKKEEFITDEDIRDVVRLICMFICLTLFFSTSGVTIAWTYVHCMEKIEEIQDYDWAQSIAEILTTSMHKFHEKPRDAIGCVVALMYWICKHTDLIPRPQNEAIPRLLQWNTSNLKKRFDDFEDLTNVNIKGLIKEHIQMGKFCDSLLKDNDQVIIKDLQQQVQDLQNQKQILEQQNHGLETDKDAMKNQLVEMEKERDALKEKLQKMVTMFNTILQTQEQHKFLLEKTAVLEKDNNAMKNQLLKMEKERDLLKEKLQKMDTMSNKILQAKEQNTADLEKRKQMMMQ
ncbi:hypothetical protein RHSIM_Rhsim12G0081900 [Rhododendron simsii]|uniref:Uncharacterized protein n=1 Tax=Rhododendron simsii TaxID=118357 RepID=A0A834G5G2_RHOSS|nr:hypothetical protein RHSIM_Rhsim12G0081900 [Rhododendron simsii]